MKTTVFFTLILSIFAVSAYVICQTGRRSQKGAEILQKAGFKNIYNINGGTSAWENAGFPTEK